MTFDNSSSGIWNSTNVDFSAWKSNKRIKKFNLLEVYLDNKYAKNKIDQNFAVKDIKLTKINDGKHELTMDIPFPNQNKRVYDPTVGINFKYNFYKEYMCDWTIDNLLLFKLA